MSLSSIKFSNKGFLVAAVVILTMIGMLLLTSASYFLSLYNNTDSINQLDNKANLALDSAFESFRATLIRTNTDGGGYITNGASRNDINNDDDDFDGSTASPSGTADDDGDAFKYVFGITHPDDYTNVWNMFPDDEQYRGNTIQNYQGLRITTTGLLSYDFYVFDGQTYANDHTLLAKSNTGGYLSGTGTTVLFDQNAIKKGDIVAMFFRNLGIDDVMYKISGVDINGGTIPKFVSYKQSDRNFHFYPSIILQDQKGNFLRFTREYAPVLPKPMKPIAPSFLHAESASGALAKLTWDANESDCTGHINLYRSGRGGVSCDDSFLLDKDILPTTESYQITDNAGIMEYVLCQVCKNSLGVESMSTPSNTITIKS